MYKLTASKSADGIVSTAVVMFLSFAVANRVNWSYQDAGYTVTITKVA